MSTRTLKALLAALFAGLLCALALVPTTVSAQNPQKAPGPKMRPMGAPPGVTHFQLRIDGNPVANFQEISGLQSENDVIEYRNGAGNLSPRKLPGHMKGPRITLKRGVVINGGLAAWLDAIRAGNQTGRRQATVVLYNIQNQPVKSWRFTNAWATKWKGPALNAKGNDKSIEELVLSADNIEIVPIKK